MDVMKPSEELRQDADEAYREGVSFLAVERIRSSAGLLDEAERALAQCEHAIGSLPCTVMMDGDELALEAVRALLAKLRSSTEDSDG